MTDDLKELESHVDQFLAAAREQHAAHRTLPALALVYTIIDVVGSLERKEEEGTRKAFVRWVETNLLPDHRLPCTGLELYAARCGVLHSLTPDADLVTRGEARRLAYAWGKGSADDLREIAKRLKRADVVAIHVGDFIDAVEGAFRSYLQKVAADGERLKLALSRTSKWFANLPMEVAADFLQRTAGRAT
jgi:hypothetical protein